MATPDNSTRRLRLVDDQQDQPAEAAAPDGELTAKQAAAFAALGLRRLSMRPAPGS